jgi:Rrf2 family protein
LFTLVEHHGGSPIPIRELARRNDVPKRFLEQIMLDIKAQGWVESAAGARGGYVLAKSPSQITMGEVARHFDGILAPIDCVSVTGYKRCSQESVCLQRRRKPSVKRPSESVTHKMAPFLSHSEVAWGGSAGAMALIAACRRMLALLNVPKCSLLMSFFPRTRVQRVCIQQNHLAPALSTISSKSPALS